MTGIPEQFKVNREVKTGVRRLTDVFGGLEHSPAILGLYRNRGDALKFLDRVGLRVIDTNDYMYVDPWDGRITAGRRYILEEESRILYLDVIHELVHVKQWFEGKELYDRRYSYIERPTELKAYTVVVEEARRIGLAEKEIVEYLEVPWISKKELQLMAKKLGVTP
nr:hypothetical protein [Candidatus Njordarchaeum guaymaensis]